MENLARSARLKPQVLELGGGRNSGKLWLAGIAVRLCIRESWWPINGGRVSALTFPGDGARLGEDPESWDAESEMSDGV